jgi:predicted AAA+ superfamily ATPase
MKTYDRWYKERFRRFVAKPFVQIMFGARQTGKSTLIKQVLPSNAQVLDLSQPEQRLHFLADPQALIRLCQSLPAPPNGQPTVIFIDEVQTVPELFNAIQSLYDADKTRFRFVLCGSSARRLRTTGANLLPGRSMLHRLHPLINEEYERYDQWKSTDLSPLPLAWQAPEPSAAQPQLFPARTLENRLAFGDLPAIACLDNGEDRRELLRSYAAIHLEEEIRSEAAIRQWPAFLHFLQLAASRSGSLLNFQGMAKEVGVSGPTIQSYYQLLEDMYVGFSVPSLSGSAYKAVVSSHRFYFFDLGVRNAVAGAQVDESIVGLDPGHLFEQWVACELYRKLSYLGEGQLYHYRTRSGAEIDFVVQWRNELIPIEAKWTENPTMADARHLRSFLQDSQGKATRGYIVCRTPFPQQLDAQITALPWQAL